MPAILTYIFLNPFLSDIVHSHYLKNYLYAYLLIYLIDFDHERAGTWNF